MIKAKIRVNADEGGGVLEVVYVVGLSTEDLMKMRLGHRLTFPTSELNIDTPGKILLMSDFSDEAMIDKIRRYGTEVPPF
jgi:hypothetical protein